MTVHTRIKTSAENILHFFLGEREIHSFSFQL